MNKYLIFFILAFISNINYAQDVADNDTLAVFEVVSENPGINLEEQNARIREHFSIENNKVEDPGVIYTGGIYRLVSSGYMYSGLDSDQPGRHPD